MKHIALRFLGETGFVPGEICVFSSKVKTERMKTWLRNRYSFFNAFDRAALLNGEC